MALFLLGCLLFNYPLLVAVQQARRDRSASRCSTSTSSAPGPLLIALMAWVVETAGEDHSGDAAGLGDRQPSPSPTWACCSPSPTTATSAPTPAARIIANPTSTRCRWRSTARPGPSTAASGARPPTGIGFLPIYLGPTLMAALWWFVMLKIIRISKAQPHHLDRRLHRLALRQEPAARRPGDHHRRGRHHSLHRAAAEGDLQQLHHPAAVPRDRRCRPSGGAAAAARTTRSTSR